MELLLILTYTAICVAIFRIPVNKWTLPTAALGGVEAAQDRGKSAELMIARHTVPVDGYGPDHG